MRKVVVLLTFLSILTFGTVLAACQEKPQVPLSSTNGTSVSPIQPLPGTASSGIVEKLTLEDLAARANKVLLGKVTDIAYRKDANGIIFTLATFSIEQILKGETTKEVVITIPGGKLNGQAQVVEDAPSLELGQRAIVFLEENNGISRIVGGFQGEFTIGLNNLVGNVPLQQFLEQVSIAIAKQ